MTQDIGTAKDHLDWCVKRAMDYANAGNWAGAWGSFLSDVAKHSGTEYIARHDLLHMAMFSGLYNEPREFEDFITGWAVG